MNIKLISISLAIAGIALTVAGCSTKDFESFSSVGSSVLAQTGVVSGSQADAIFKFGGTLNNVTEEITEEQEYYLGRGVAANVLGKYKVLNNKPILEYLNVIAIILANNSEKPLTFGGYKVQILDTEEINALSAPGGFIFVSKGFLKIVPNEDALAGLLAHEIAHIVKGHGMSSIKNADLTAGLIALGKAATPSEIAAVTAKLTQTFEDSIDSVVSSLLTKGYSRSQEYAADTYALTLLEKTGYSPVGLQEMLKSLETKAYDNSTGGWNSTHPEASDRIDELDLDTGTSSIGKDARDKRFKSIFAAL